jgi:hypothetical protein
MIITSCQNSLAIYWPQVTTIMNVINQDFQMYSNSIFEYMYFFFQISRKRALVIQSSAAS